MFAIDDHAIANESARGTDSSSPVAWLSEWRLQRRLLRGNVRCVLLAAAFALACQPLRSYGQSSASEIDALKSRLGDLDRQMQEIRAQLERMEAQQHGPEAAKAANVPPAVMLPTITSPPQNLYIGYATEQRDTANQEEVGVARIDNESLDPSRRGYFRLPLTDTLIQINGFVKADFFYDTTYAGTYDGAYVLALFPSGPQLHSSNSTVSMKASRLGLTVLQPASGKTVKGYFEMDALGSTSGTAVRIRHIYAQYLNILGGQTWSAFSDPDVFPDTLEFEGPPGIIGLRHAQLRYTQPLNHKNSIGVSVERSGTDAPSTTPFGNPFGTSLRPDLVAFYRLETKHGHIQSAFISRSVGGTIVGATDPRLQQHLNGYGTSLSGAFAFGSAGRDGVVAQAVIGRGISNYYNDNFGLGSDVGFSANNRLVTTPSGSGTAGYVHKWTPTMRSNISYGFLRINNTALDPGTNYHLSRYSTASFVVQPKINYLFGAEFIYGSLERKNGFYWVAPRIQLSATYYLNKHPRE